MTVKLTFVGKFGMYYFLNTYVMTIIFTTYLESTPLLVCAQFNAVYLNVKIKK